MARDTIAALATPPGAAAVALLRVSGPAAWKSVSGLLELERPPEPRRQTLAWAVDGARRLDRLLITLFPAEASYTGEETVELSCHGSPFVVGRLLTLLRSAGARDARPGEFTQRAFLAGRLDLAQAEAVCELIASRGEAEHRAAVAALEGGLSRRVGELADRARALAALVEANLDHPDTDIPPVDPAAASDAALTLAEETGRAAAARRRGRPGAAPRVVLLGAPNAGKSSLLNALLGADRALVSDEPGTTRDAVSADAVLGSVSCCLVDTAGLRGAPAGAVEAMGQEKARCEARAADLAVLVVDRTAPPEAARLLAAEALSWTSRDRLAVALNKTDLPGAVTGPAHLDGLESVCVSALDGTGVAELARLAGRRLGAVEPGTFSVTERQGAALESAREGFVEASTELRAGREEIAARALRAALSALDSVVGKDTAEETLAAVFSRFCVGK